MSDFDRDLFLYKAATKKPSPLWERERNFVELFRLAAQVKRQWRSESNIMKDGSGI